MTRSLAPWLLPLFFLTGCKSCSQEPEDLEKNEPVSDVDNDGYYPPDFSQQGSADPRQQRAADPNDPNTLVYLVGTDNRLYSFSPRVPGRAAYRLVGDINCPSRASPQSMSVDRHGSAWVFYNSGELFKLDIRTARCSATGYVHPTRNTMLGMGFTAVSPGSTDEQLFMSSPDFGLATVSIPGLKLSASLAKFDGAAELTGGGDGKLFRYQADTSDLSEVDLQTRQLKPVHRFQMGRVSAFAFARYAGKFYMFTSDQLEQSRATEFDPKTGKEHMRDAAVGMVVVGAGQSTLAPRDDQGTQIQGGFP